MDHNRKLSLFTGDTFSFTPDLIHHIIERNVKKYTKERLALIYAANENEDDGEESIILTYHELNDRAHALAVAISHSYSELTQCNPEGDVLIAVCMEPSIKQLLVLLAIWKLGGGYVPLDIRMAPNHIRNILKDCKPVLLVLDNAYANTLIFGNINAISLRQLERKADKLKNESILTMQRHSHDFNMIACALYTSGRIGSMKGVRLTHLNILNRLKWQKQNLSFDPVTERLAIYKTNFTFVDSLAEIWAPLINGLTLVIAPKRQRIPELIALLDEYNIQRITVTPRQLNAILTHVLEKPRSKHLSSVRLWMSSGERLTKNLALKFFKYFDERQHTLYNFYGLTEVAGDITYFQCRGREHVQSLPMIPLMGDIMSNMVLYILDEDARPVGIGQRGQVFIGGIGLTENYVGGQNFQQFVENKWSVGPAATRALLKTDDCASFENNRLMYHGRMSEQIAFHGHSYSLVEMENYILEMEEVETCVVLSELSKYQETIIFGYVVLQPGSEHVTTLSIESKLKGKLPCNLLPRIIILKDIPHLLNEKIDRRSLLRLREFTTYNNMNDQIEYDFENVQESDMAACKALFDALVQVLGPKMGHKISVDLSYFEIGGNSLNAMAAVAELDKMGYHISITDFIAVKNLAELLSLLRPKSNETINSTASQNIHLALSAIAMDDKCKDDLKKIIGRSLYEKSRLATLLKPNLMESDFHKLIDYLWEEIIGQGLSFLVKDERDVVVGAIINFDVEKAPVIVSPIYVTLISEMKRSLEKPVLEYDVQSESKRVMEVFMSAINTELSAQDTIAVMLFMEQKIIEMAKEQEFTGIITTHLSPIEQQISEGIYGYTNLCEYPVNKFVSRIGVRPFKDAPDTLRGVVHWLNVEKSRGE